jgi:hypothetical protein
VGGTVASGGTIKFRIGLKTTYSATNTYPARYAVVVVTYGTPAKTFNLYLRQGEDPDYVWSPSEYYPYGGSTDLRTSAVKFSPYNLTASGLTDVVKYIPVAVGGGVFTAYPTQAGAFFQWANETNPRYAYHPVTPADDLLSVWDTNTPTGFWDTLGSTYETCPQSYSLTTGTSVNFRRPNDGSTSAANPAGDVAGSEMRQSLWEDPQIGQTFSVIGSVGGFYADGFFDRRSHTHTAYGISGRDNSAVSILTKDVAYIGRLFYNRDNKRSLFFPALGSRNENHVLYVPGHYGVYLSSSSFDTYRCWSLCVSGGDVAYETSEGKFDGEALRCVRE